MSFRQDAVRAANERIYQAWLGKHPEIAACDANRQIIFEYIADDDENISGADLDFVVSNVRDRLALAPIQVDREPQEQPDPAIAAKLEVERLRHLTRDELKQEMHLAEKQRLQQLYAKPPLPTHWTVDGKEIELTTRSFMNLDKSEIRKILRIHGAEQVDLFLGVKPRQQPGNLISINI